MRYAVLISITLLLAGCFHEPDRPCDNSIHQYTSDRYADNGVHLIASGEFQRASWNEMVKYYDEILSCAVSKAEGTVSPTTPGPHVEFVYFPHRYGSIGGWGSYIPVAQTVHINTYGDHDGDDRVRNCISDRDTLKHEYLHHILYMNGLDWRHSSPTFAACGVIGVKTCNGVPCE